MAESMRYFVFVMARSGVLSMKLFEAINVNNKGFNFDFDYETNIVFGQMKLLRSLVMFRISFLSLYHH